MTASENSPLLGGAEPSTSKQQEWRATPRILFLLVTLNFGTFLAAVDTTIVSTLLSSISSDLKALDSISWVATAYLIAYSAFQPLYGKLSDIYGRKLVLQVTTFLFGLGCQICGMSYSMGPLIVGRLLNGIGAGGMLSICSIAVGDYVPAHKRGVYQGITNIAFCLGASSGGLIGSAALAYSGWRFAFLVQVPMAIVSLISISFMDVKKPEDTASEEGQELSPFERIDWVGAATLAAGVILLMLGVTTGGHQFPWASWQIASFFGGSLVLFATFAHWETNHAVEPVLPLDLLANPSVLSCCLGNFFGSGAFFSYLYYVPLYLSACLDYSAIRISQLIIFNFVGETIGAVTAGAVMHKTGRYYALGVASGFGLLASGIMYLYYPMSSEFIQDSWWYQDAAFFVLGFFYAIFLSVSVISLIAAAPKHQATTISAQYSFRGVGSSVNLAVCSALFNHVLRHNLREKITGEDAHKIIHKVSKSIAAIHKIPAKFMDEAIESYRAAAISIFALIIGYEVIHIVCMSCNEENPLVEPEEGFGME